MIINLFNTEKFPIISSLNRYFRSSWNEFLSLFFFKALYKDSKYLKKFFKYYFPQLRLDEQGISSCTSCKLCEEICPTDCIEIVKANMVNFPSSLTAGEVPLHFYLHADHCIRCGLCQDVCPVNALEMKAKYHTSEIDLIN